jgi:hypothetical protein
MEKETPIWCNEGDSNGPYNCSLYPGYLLKKVSYTGYPKYWLITSDDEVPKVKANLGDCDYSEAKIRFLLWMEGKSWS